MSTQHSSQHTQEQSVDQDTMPPKLSSEDLQRVEKYLSSPVHQVERHPFRPWLMMLGLVGVVVFLGGISLLISKLVLG